MKYLFAAAAVVSNKDSFEAWYRAQTKYAKPEDRDKMPNVKKHKSYSEGLKAKPAQKNARKMTDQKKKKAKSINNRSANPEYLSVQEAAAIAKVSSKKILYWINRNKFPYVRSSSVIRINKVAFENYLKEQKGGI